MGNSNFFSKLASMTPLAQALNLPGAHKYAQSQAQAEAGKAGASGGAYTGIAPTLAAANGGYQPGGPGANTDWHQYVPHDPSNFFQKQANVAGNLSVHPDSSGNAFGFSKPQLPTGANTFNPTANGNMTANPYVTAAMGAASQKQASDPNKMWS